tara:strand:+ start:197 stop:442 length:246 start_codon:yes stop_codon:yes gene_type:complete
VRTVVRAAVTTVSPAFSATLETVVVNGERVSVMAFQLASRGPTIITPGGRDAAAFAVVGWVNESSEDCVSPRSRPCVVTRL